MLTGVELAGIILATFPLVISGLEHYENGFQQIKDWIRFRADFAKFMNALCRQRIFFRQNIEELLAPVVASEYEMSQLLDNPGGQAWADPELNEKLIMRLPGEYEYECYISTAVSILELLEKLKLKLKIVEGQLHWTESGSSSGRIRWEYEFKRISYTFGKKKREKLMSDLEKHNNEIQTLLGNSERLEPMRRRRRSAIPSFFQRIRTQACSLHSALNRAWKCECSSSHATKLLLEKRVNKDGMGLAMIEESPAVKFGVFFCLKTQPRAVWCATEIKMGTLNTALSRKISQGTDFGRRFSQVTHTSTQQELEVLSPTRGSISSQGGTISSASRLLDTSSRSVSFLSGGLESLPASVPSDGSEIMDLCSALEQISKSQQSLGILKDGPDRYHTIDLATSFQLSPSDTSRVITLGSLLVQGDPASNKGKKPLMILPRRTRLEIAVILANSLLQLHAGPWLADVWSKKDIHFFQSHDGSVQVKHPFLLHHFKSTNKTSSADDDLAKLELGRPQSRVVNSSLFSLGVVVLELWFNQTLESRPFRTDFLGPDGRENEYTDFNTVQKWQEMTMEEAGPDLFNPTRRCIYCAFGAASRDLEDEELRKAVYSEVVEPLERLLGRFEDVSAN
ncbi:MAG: hypothetical protein M1829_005227 [Trizodia sp. TS-e1964]|nr:MAG: hypothetical protein M1829_005227 [Trizodia sp. TS-e1964]